jgi:hypothetical protein
MPCANWRPSSKRPTNDDDGRSVTGEQQPVDPGENQLVADDAKDAHETAGEEYLETYTYQWRVLVG